MTPWPVRRLGDIADEGQGEIRTGPFGSQLHRYDYTDSADGVPLVMPLNMVDGRVNSRGIARVSQAKASAMAAHITRAGDVLLSRRGDIGRYCLIDTSTAGALCGTGSLRVSVQGSELMPEYLCFYLQTSAGLHELQGRAVGSTMLNINTSIVRSLQLPVPPLRTQHKIVAFLSAYSDLIENNNRRIQILEEMTQRIYHDWFVDFRYPGHKDAPLVDSELGTIPQGWQSISLGEWCTVVVGSTPSRKIPAYWRDGDVPWINSSQINDLCVVRPTELITKAAYESTSTKMMPIGSTLVAVTGATLGQVSYLAINACGSQNVCGVFAANPAEAPYLYYAITNVIGSIVNRAVGGAQQHINRGIVREALVVKPSESVLAAFYKIAQVSLDEMVSLLCCQETLRATRDVLLPCLISGEIDVTDLNIAMPEEDA